MHSGPPLSFLFFSFSSSRQTRRCSSQAKSKSKPKRSKKPKRKAVADGGEIDEQERAAIRERIRLKRAPGLRTEPNRGHRGGAGALGGAILPPVALAHAHLLRHCQPGTLQHQWWRVDSP